MKYAFYTANFGFFGEAAALADYGAGAEAAGWDGDFIWDHLQVPGMEPTVDPWVALTAMAMRTERLVLRPMITPVPRRDIAKLARETVSIDHLSDGRLVLGVGLGWNAFPEFVGFGHEPDLKSRGAMLDEALDVLAALWSSDAVEHRGEHYTVSCDGFGRPVREPRIPIWVGGTWPSKKPIRRAARWDGVFPIAFAAGPRASMPAGDDVVGGRLQPPRRSEKDDSAARLVVPRYDECLARVDVASLANEVAGHRVEAPAAEIDARSDADAVVGVVEGERRDAAGADDAVRVAHSEAQVPARLGLEPDGRGDAPLVVGGR